MPRRESRCRTTRRTHLLISAWMESESARKEAGVVSKEKILKRTRTRAGLVVDGRFSTQAWLRVSALALPSSQRHRKPRYLPASSPARHRLREAARSRANQ